MGDSEEKPALNGSIGTEARRREPSKGGGRADIAPDERPVSWAGVDENDAEAGHARRPEPQRRISGSLDDLHVGNLMKDGEKRGRAKDKLRSRTQVIGASEDNGEPNRLADILDSIKKASLEQNSRSHGPGGGGLLTPGLNKSGLQTKSYSYSCLADLKLDEQGGLLG